MVLSRTSLVPWYLQGKAILIASINLFFLLLSMLYPLKTETWTFMQHRKSLDFVYTTKETAQFIQLLFTIIARAFSSSLPEKPGSWSTNCQLTANATQDFPHIHNRFCFLRTCRTLLLLPIFGFPFHFQSSISGFCNALLSKKDTCAFPLPQAKETTFWKGKG